MKRVLVCFFGTCSRSIKYTHENHKTHLLNILEKHYKVDIYVFNNNVDKLIIDGVVQNNTDSKVIQSTHYEEESQATIDNKICNLIHERNIDTTMRYDYPQNTIKNAIRQMYSEEKVGKFIESHIEDYDCAIVCNPDIYFTNEINLSHIEIAMNNTDCVFTTNIHDAQGYTNGFYIGAPKPISRILKRFSILELLLPTNKDYEYLLKRAFEINNITRLISDTAFLKIRSDKSVFTPYALQIPSLINEIRSLKHQISLLKS